MPRLKHKKTGVVINVDDETAKVLPSEWVKPSTRKAAPKAEESEAK